MIIVFILTRQKENMRNIWLYDRTDVKNVIRKTIRSAEYYVNYAFQGGEPTLRGIEFLRKLLSFRKSLISTELQLIIQFRQMAIILMRTGANF